MANFTGKRYLTQGIHREIPFALQIRLWGMIDAQIQENKNMDYLQIFELKAVHENGARMQEIIHKQEIPKRKQRITIQSKNPISAKIFVIDSVEYITMLFNHEY